MLRVLIICAVEKLLDGMLEFLFVLLEPLQERALVTIHD